VRKPPAADANSFYFGDGHDGVLNTKGDVNLQTYQDGPMVVKMYKSVTINAGHKVTTSMRNRGVLIYSQGDCVIDGELSMTKRGAKFDPTESVPSTGLKIGFPTSIANGGTDTLQASTMAGAGSEAMAAVKNHPSHGLGKLFIINRFGANGAPGNEKDSHGSVGGSGSNVRLNLMSGGGGGGATGYHGIHGVHLASGAQGTAFSGGAGAGGTRDSGSSLTAVKQYGTKYPAEKFGGAGGGGSGGGNWASGGGAGNPGGKFSAGGTYKKTSKWRRWYRGPCHLDLRWQLFRERKDYCNGRKGRRRAR